jgi:lysophospholipase L1-like esterase
MTKIPPIAKKTLMAFGIVALIIVLSFMILFLGCLNSNVKCDGLIRVACVGDSITEGSGYPENLQVMLGDNYMVGNFGVSGSTVLQNSDMPYMNEPAFWRAIAFQPSIVVVMLGTNDAKESPYGSVENFQSDYKELIREYETLESNPKIWLVTPPPIFKNDLNLNNTNLEQTIIPSIEYVANELDLPTVDVNTALIDYPEYFMDGVHPSSNGAMLIASKINQAIIFNGLSDAPF